MTAIELLDRLTSYANLNVEVTVKTGSQFKSIENVGCDINGDLIIYLEEENGNKNSHSRQR